MSPSHNPSEDTRGRAPPAPSQPEPPALPRAPLLSHGPSPSGASSLMLPQRAPKQEADPQPGGTTSLPHHSDPMAVLRMLVSSPAKEAQQQQQQQQQQRGSSASRLPGHPTEAQSVLGGKASCRRKFVLNVALMDEQGLPVEKDLSVTASLTYAHDHSPVKVEEGQTMVEPPLFTTFNGVEFPAHLRPSQMIAGKASFKLALSVLSSKCDNRLFSVRFTATGPAGQSTEAADNVRVLPGYSEAIRSISRKRSRASLLAWGGSPPTASPLLAPAQHHSPLALALRPPLLAEGSANYSPQSPGVYRAAPSPSLEGSPSMSTGADVSNHSAQPRNFPEVSTAILPQQRHQQQQQHLAQHLPCGAQLKHIQQLLQEHCMSPAASHSSPPAPRPSPLSRGTSSASSWQHQDHAPLARHPSLASALSAVPQGTQALPEPPEGACLLPLQPFPPLDTGACLQRPNSARPYLTHQQASLDRQHALEQPPGASAASPNADAPAAAPPQGQQEAGTPVPHLDSGLPHPAAAGGPGLALGVEASKGRMPPALGFSPLSTPLDAPLVCPPPSFMSPFHLSPPLGPAPQDHLRSLGSNSAHSGAGAGAPRDGLGAPASRFATPPLSHPSPGSQEGIPSDSKGLSGTSSSQGQHLPELCCKELSHETLVLPRGRASDMHLSPLGAPGVQTTPALQSNSPRSAGGGGYLRRANGIQYRLVKLLPPGRLSLQRSGQGLKPNQAGEPESGALATGEGSGSQSQSQSLNPECNEGHKAVGQGLAQAEGPGGVPVPGGLGKRFKGSAPKIVLPPRMMFAPRACSRMGMGMGMGMGPPAALGPCLSPLKFSPHFRASPLYCSPSRLSPHMLSPLGRVLMHFAPTPSPKGPCSPKVTEQGQSLGEELVGGGSPSMGVSMGSSCKGLSGPGEGGAPFLSDLQGMHQAVAEGTG